MSRTFTWMETRYVVRPFRDEFGPDGADLLVGGAAAKSEWGFGSSRVATMSCSFFLFFDTQLYFNLFL